MEGLPKPYTSTVRWLTSWRVGVDPSPPSPGGTMVYYDTQTKPKSRQKLQQPNDIKWEARKNRHSESGTVIHLNAPQPWRTFIRSLLPPSLLACPGSVQYYSQGANTSAPPPPPPTCTATIVPAHHSTPLCPCEHTN